VCEEYADLFVAEMEKEMEKSEEEMMNRQRKGGFITMPFIIGKKQRHGN